MLPDRGKGEGVQLAAKGQVCRSSTTVFPFLCVTILQFNDLPPEVRPFKPDQNLKAELKASSAPGFDMAIGQVGIALQRHQRVPVLTLPRPQTSGRSCT